MDIYGSFPPISAQDLYDFYGLASLNYKTLDQDTSKSVDFHMKKFREHYMHALRVRFAYWSKNGKAPPTIEEMMKELRDSLYESITNQADKMRLGGGFNMLAAVKAMRGEAEQKIKEDHSEGKTLATNLAGFNAADYKKIAKCVLDLWEAKTTEQIMIVIDTLNGLQHCGGYVLIDFVAGHRDPSDPEGKRVLAEILDIKRNAKSPKEFFGKMSSDIRKLVNDELRAKASA